MEKLTYFDIKERQNHLNSSSYTSNTAGVSIDYLFENLGERYSFNNAKLILENWRYLSESEIEAFDKALETFLIICGNDTDQNIKKAASIIEGKIIENPYYDLIDSIRIIYIRGIGHFIIQDVKENIADSDTKIITAFSLEYAASTKYLDGFRINTGEDDSLEYVYHIQQYDHYILLIHAIQLFHRYHNIF